ncbi:MAG: DMT family transporter [Gordonia sp. (in: high G+C Gram-positive bacteria)]
MLAVVGAAVLWGTTGTAAAQAPALAAVAVGAGAMGFGGIAQIVVTARALRAAADELRRRWPVVAVGVCCVVGYPLAFYGSMRVAGVAIGTVVSLAAAPLASAVIERVAEGRSLTARWALACVLGVVGSALLCVAGESGEGAGSSIPTGVGLGLLAGATYASYSWAMRRLMLDRGPSSCIAGRSGTGVSRAAAAGAVLGGGGVLLLPIFAVTAPAVWSAREVAVLGYLAIVPMFVGYVLFSYGLAHVDASTATTLTLAEPAFATVLAVVIVGEQVTALGWLGLAGIAAALVVLTMPRPRFRRPARQEAQAMTMRAPACEPAMTRRHRG